MRKLKKEADEAPEGPSKEAAVEAANDYQQAICHKITGEMMPPTIQDAIKLVQCKDVEGYNHPKWMCVLHTCTCCPDYKDNIPDHEKQAEVDGSNLDFKHIGWMPLHVCYSVTKTHILVRVYKKCTFYFGQFFMLVFIMNTG